MGSEYLVSICIPTYNRAECLKKCIESLVVQPEFLEGNVEIVISNNASTDNTEEVVKKFLSQYENIVYYNTIMKGGAVRATGNFAIVMQLAHGVLRKLGGDTRIYKKGSLGYFCKAAQKYACRKPVLYFGNGGNPSGINEEKRITDIESFLKATGFMICWIDTFFLWDEECQGLLELDEQSTSEFWFVEKSIELMCNKNEAIFFTKRVITPVEPKGKDVSYGIFNMFNHNYLGIIRSLVKRQIVTPSILEYLEKDLLLNFFTSSLALWEVRRGKYAYIYSDTEDLKALVFLYYKNKPYFKEFKKKYRRIKWKLYIKSIPVLGDFLVMMKHLLVRKF